MGDRVRIRNGDTGTVIASIDAHEYTLEAKQEDWAYLGTGIVVRTDAGALVRFADPLAPGLLWRDSGANDGKPM